MIRWAALHEAIACAEGGELDGAREAVWRASGEAGGDPIAQVVAGIVLFVTRDYHDALGALGRAAELDPRVAKRALRMRVARAGRLGWTHDEREAQEALVAIAPGDARALADAARLLAQARDYEDALPYLDRALALEPSAAAAHMERASLLAKLDRAEDALAAADRALALRSEDPKYALEAARVAIDVGALDVARARLALARAQHPADPGIAAALAELDAWTDDTPPAPPADDDDSSSAHLLRAERALGEGRYDDVHAHLTRASMGAGGFLPVAWMLRFLASERQNKRGRVPPYVFEEFVELVLEVCPDSRAAFESRDPALVRPFVLRTLAAMRGNRSTTPTYVRDGRLVRAKIRGGPRHDSRRALERIRVAPPDEALAALDAVAARYPTSSMPAVHRGELELWLGRTHDARASFERALAIHDRTRFAYIGLTGCAILEGDLEGALRVSARGVRAMNDTEGPAVYVYRGEALRRLGRFDEARADLERAVAIHASRAGAWINLGLLYAATSDAGGVARVRAQLEQQAPGLLSDASRGADRGDTPAVLERALHMLRGNRSSSTVTYFSGDGRLRFVPQWPHAGPGPHATDASDLRQARTILRAASGVAHPPRRARDR